MNITFEMVAPLMTFLGVLAAVSTIFINRFGRADDRMAKLERDLADHKLKTAERYVTSEALATFDERLLRTEERMLGELRAVRADVSAAMSGRTSRRRAAQTEVDGE